MGVILFLNFVNFESFWRIVKSCVSTERPANSYQNTMVLKHLGETEPIFTILSDDSNVVVDRPFLQLKNRKNVIYHCDQFVKHEREATSNWRSSER